MAAKASPAVFKLLQNLTIIGPPGSGKGFYGHRLAKAWNVPLITTSTILRASSAGDRSSSLDLDSGRLVDCEKVSNILLEYLEKCHNQDHYLLDGFPRTARQIELMQNTWPEHHQVCVALHLNIPDEVCRQKSLGRKHCSLCRNFVNVADVQVDQFDLPPTFPEECHHKKYAKQLDRPCSEHWTTRKDDTEYIINQRLRQYHENQDSIIDYFRTGGQLLQVVPYRGILDMSLLQKTCEEWLVSHFPEH